MGSKFFSHRTPDRTRKAGGQLPSENGLEARDHQQALVLGALRRAAGAPVSFAELRAAGVELPASVASELELAGLTIERCLGERRGAVGVRLDPANDPATRLTPDPVERAMPTDTDTDTDTEPAWSRVRTYRASALEGRFPRILAWLSSPSGRRAAARPAMAAKTKTDPVRERPFGANPWSRVLAVMALLAGIVVVVSFVAVLAAGSDRATRAPIARRSHRRVVIAAGGSRPARAPRSTRPSAPVPESPAIATELEAQGHTLLEAGRYGAAVPVLERAVRATGETLGACLEPDSSACLTYAYALYDLGRATRLSGEPQAAVPILERRLRIDNQRSTVGAQLQLARQGIG